jgi:hypothetical protein
MSCFKLLPLALLLVPACSGATIPEAESSDGTESSSADGSGSDTLGAVCGDGIAEGDEICDGADVGEQTCEGQGAFVGGTLACAVDCSSFDVSACEADPAGPVVVFNEVSSQEVTQGTFAGAGDAVEFYNAGGAAADLSGWVVSDDPDFPEDKTYAFPAGTTLAPGAFLVIVKLDEDTGEGDFPFGISSSEEETLTLADGSGSTVSQVTFVGADATISWCRLPDGTGDFGFCVQTFGASNSAGEPQPEPECGNGMVEADEECDGEDLDGEGCEDVGDFVGGDLACNDDCTFETSACEDASAQLMVVINEFSSTSPDPIELYNAGDDDVDLSGWILTDDLADPEDRYDPEADAEELVFPDGTILEAGEFLVVEEGDVPNHPFGLSGGGDVIALMDADLTVVDFIEYGDGEAADSFCRLPDGPDGDWTSGCTPSFGDSNEE